MNYNLDIPEEREKAELEWMAAEAGRDARVGAIAAVVCVVLAWVFWGRWGSLLNDHPGVGSASILFMVLAAVGAWYCVTRLLRRRRILAD